MDQCFSNCNNFQRAVFHNNSSIAIRINVLKSIFLQAYNKWLAQKKRMITLNNILYSTYSETSNNECFFFENLLTT